MKKQKTDLVCGWLEKARRDLAVVERELASATPFTDVACFHAQLWLIVPSQVPGADARVPRQRRDRADGVAQYGDGAGAVPAGDVAGSRRGAGAGTGRGSDRTVSAGGRLRRAVVRKVNVADFYRNS